jgi:CRP/FNR family transcriptional regulator, cyclic AMP receptor protein
MSEPDGFKKIKAKRHQIVFQEDDPGESMFIVQSGAVGIFKTIEGERVQLAVLKDGEMFGEMAIIDGRKRMADAMAVEDSMLLQVPRKTLEERLSKFDPFLQALVEVLTNNLRTVHKSYMHRPRSVDDFLNAIDYHNDGFKKYMGMTKNQEIASDVTSKLLAIDELVLSLRDMLKHHDDSRNSVFGETDIARRQS